MRPVQLLVPLLTFSSIVAAWPSPDSREDLSNADNIRLFRRQDASTTDAPSPPTPASDTAASTTNAGSSRETSQASTGESTIVLTGSRASRTGSRTASASNANATEFDPRLPAGGIDMLTPAPTDGPQYYKIGDWVSFAWNYTSLSVTPSAIDILAYCSKAEATFTIAMNQTVEPTGKVYWDTGAYQKTATKPLLTEMYTLIIYDAASSVTATAKAGYLGTFRQFTFGMYAPEAYTPWADWNCPACNGAISSVERQTLGFLFGMATVTVLSFTWFAGNFGIF